MNQIRHAVGLDGIKYKSRRIYIVADEVLIVISTNLSLQHNDYVSSDEMSLPIPGFSKIRIFGSNVWLHTMQNLKISAMLVKDNDVSISTRAQASNKILTYQTGSAREKNFAFFSFHCNSIHILKTEMRLV